MAFPFTKSTISLNPLVALIFGMSSQTTCIFISTWLGAALHVLENLCFNLALLDDIGTLASSTFPMCVVFFVFGELLSQLNKVVDSIEAFQHDQALIALWLAIE